MAVMSHDKAEDRLYESAHTRPIPYNSQIVGQESGGDDDDDDSDNHTHNTNIYISLAELLKHGIVPVFIHVASRL
ncbi:hypothetical protein IGI04_010184 [Brassica rapa subsp. trilocularis]|uniref:Uncharacterized protein n=1 Tax=Brassica rapa subsp. trilocularis TaxID=1813537 RepID=A0ABQ7N1Y0_BRACM|nr:hypothetical protein IGI04_010184 [Brassica rapa subsp. trilocularis]